MASPNSEGADLSLQTLNPRISRHAFDWYVDMTDIANGDLLTAWVPGCNGRLLGLDMYMNKPVTTALKLATVSMRINAVTVTGGVLSLTSALCTPKGVRVAGSPVTAGFTFGPTDTIGLVASAVTAFIEGSGKLVITWANDDLRTVAALAMIVPAT